MLIPEKLNGIIRILVTAPRPLRLVALAKKAQVSPGMASRLVLRLVRTGYVMIKRGRGGGITVIHRHKLIRAWGYCVSIREISSVEFVAAERPQYVMLKIARIAEKENLQYAFTLFSATELVRPYVSPETTYAYVNRKDIKKWESLLIAEKMLPAENKGTVVLLPVDDTYFEGSQKARDLKIVSLPQLYVDLFSYGGRGEEAAEQVLELVTEGGTNV